MSSLRRIRGENRFYNPPPIRKLQQEREERQKKRLQEEDEEKRKTVEKPLRQRDFPVQELTQSPETTAVSKKEKKRAASSVSSDCSVSGRVASDDSSNLGRFLEYTTPVVPVQYLPKTGINRWRARESDGQPYFLLNDLWNSFEEWSAYGVGVPLLLNGNDSVVQYYVPYLSGIQLYVNPSRTGARPRSQKMMVTL